MSASDEEARPVAGLPSPATNAQDRVRLTITTIAGHRSTGSDDDPSASEGRGTPRDTTEGLDQDARSDHSNPYHTRTLSLSASHCRHTSPWTNRVSSVPAKRPVRGGLRDLRNECVQSLKKRPPKAITPRAQARTLEATYKPTPPRSGQVPRTRTPFPSSPSLPSSLPPSLPLSLPPSFRPTLRTSLHFAVIMHDQPPPRSTPTVGWWSGETGVLTERNTVSEASGGGGHFLHDNALGEG